MNPQAPETYDVAVLGGGPAGATAATRLAQRGRRVALLERERFPRFHIGESLLSTCNDVFTALGLADEIRAAGFPPKWGASFQTADGSHSRYADFSAARGLAAPQTWQVERAKLDELMLRHAAQSGVAVHTSHRATGVAFDSDGATVTFREAEQREATLRCRAVVDATGRAGLLSRQLDLRRNDPQLQNFALYGHFRHVPRLEGRRSGDIRIVARRDAGWFWLIPMNQELMSVGVVLPKPIFSRLPRGRQAEMLSAAIADTPAMVELMREAELAWPARLEQEYSYSVTRYAGDRWLLAGDAGSFLDPVFSSGVAVALESGLEAAEALDRALGRGDLSARAFAAFDRRQAKRYAVFREFVLAFYTPSFRDLFFQPGAGARLFSAVVTVLAGRWRPDLMSRLLVRYFLLLVRVQRRFALVPRIYPREAAAEPGFLRV